jgi:hypothetical protein
MTNLVPENIHNSFDKIFKPDYTEDISYDTDYIIFSPGGSAGDGL